MTEQDIAMTFVQDRFAKGQPGMGKFMDEMTRDLESLLQGYKVILIKMIAGMAIAPKENDSTIMILTKEISDLIYEAEARINKLEP